MSADDDSNRIWMQDWINNLDRSQRSDGLYSTSGAGTEFVDRDDPAAMQSLSNVLNNVVDGDEHGLGGRPDGDVWTDMLPLSNDAPDASGALFADAPPPGGESAADTPNVIFRRRDTDTTTPEEEPVPEPVPTPRPAGERPKPFERDEPRDDGPDNITSVAEVPVDEGTGDVSIDPASGPQSVVDPVSMRAADLGRLPDGYADATRDGPDRPDGSLDLADDIAPVMPVTAGVVAGDGAPSGPGGEPPQPPSADADASAFRPEIGDEVIVGVAQVETAIPAVSEPAAEPEPVVQVEEVISDYQAMPELDAVTAADPGVYVQEVSVREQLPEPVQEPVPTGDEGVLDLDGGEGA